MQKYLNHLKKPHGGLFSLQVGYIFALEMHQKGISRLMNEWKFMKKKILDLFCFMLFGGMAVSCSTMYQIEGSSAVSSLDGKTLYLRVFENDGQWAVVDSADVEHGNFKMTGDVDSVRMVTLYMNGEALMPLILESGKIKVEISNAGLTARGTTLNDKLYDFIEKRNKFESEFLSMDRREAQMVMEGGNIDEIREQLSKESDKLTEEMNMYVKDFIAENSENALGPSIFMMLCSSLPYPVMTPQIEDIMRVVPTRFKENPLIREFLDKAKENMQLMQENQRLIDNVAENSLLKQNMK